MFKMLGRILINLFSKPATRRYPVDKREPFENARGCIEMDVSTCIFCGICQKKCPASAIKINKETKTWEIDPYKCIVCNECVTACPKKSITSSANYNAPQYEKSKIAKVKE